MKKFTLFAILLLSGLLFFSGCSDSSGDSDSTTDPDDGSVVTLVADATNINTTVTASPVVLVVDTNTTVTVTLANSEGVLLTTGDDNVTLSGTGTNTGDISEVTDNNNGTYTFIATQSIAKKVTYTATVNGVTITNPVFVEYTEAPVVDTTPPVITILGNNPVTVALNSTYTDAGATALDDVDGVITVGETSDVNTSAVGTYTVTYTATDVASNTATATRTVNVISADSTPPVITILGDNPVTVTVGETYTDAGATALDDVDGDVLVTTTGTVDTSTVGTYTITYTATDAASNTATAERTVNVTDGTTDVIVGLTAIFPDADGEYSFYQNNKFVKVNAGVFEFIGTWTGGLQTDDLKLYDTANVLITEAVPTSTTAIYHVTLLEGKDSQDNFKVQGWAIREKNAAGIEFVYFRDPADGVTPPTLFSTFGYDLTLATPASKGAAGMWVIEDGKVYASNPGGEIGTYAFDREPGTGAIATMTKGGDLVDVIVTDEYYQLRPSVIDDSNRTVEYGETISNGEGDISGKLMTINDKNYGPSAWYFEPRGATGTDPDLAYVIAAGISLDGKSWGGKGDDGWRIGANGIDLNIKIHYEGAVTSTKEGLRFADPEPNHNDNSVTPVTGTLISKYFGTEFASDDFNGTTAAARFVDYE